jgi:hypothetical protein
MLREELERQGIDLPFVATQDHEWAERLERVKALVAGEARR